MKRKLFVLLLSIFVAGAVFAEDSFFEGNGGKDFTIMFAESTLENGLFDKTDVWVTDAIKSNLISTMTRFGGFTCLDIANAKKILKVQRELESGVYSDEESIEIGKLIKAKNIINIKTTRLSSGAYIINVTLYNVETGAILGVYSSPKSYETPESYVLEAQYEPVPLLLNQLGVKMTAEGKAKLAEEISLAQKQSERNKQIALENAKREAERAELAEKERERKRKIEEEEREYQRQRAKEEKEEYEAAQRELQEKKQKEIEAKLAEKRKNPLKNEVYSTEIQNGTKFDSYTIQFTSVNQCTVTVSSTNSSGETKTVTKSGTYTYSDELLTFTVNMPNQDVKHVQKIVWKGKISFVDDEFSSFYMLIPVGSTPDAKRVKATFIKN